MSLVMSMQFIVGDDWNDTCKLNTFSPIGNDVIFPESRREVALHFYKYLIYEWSNLRVLLEASSATRLTLCMYHGCFYTVSFVFDHHALYMSIEQKSHIEIFRKGSVQEFYRLKALIALEQVIISALQKKKKKLRVHVDGF